MRKNISVIFFISATISIVLGIAIYFAPKSNGNIYAGAFSSNTLKSNTSLALMLESETERGTYTQSDQASWPTEGYVFNSELSKCENGGNITYDEENNKIILESNVSDKCYVYFDRIESTIEAPTINDVTIDNNVINQATFNVQAVGGTGKLTYKYHIEYQTNNADNKTSEIDRETVENPAVLTNLSNCYEYNISITVIDELGHISSPYTTKVKPLGSDICNP